MTLAKLSLPSKSIGGCRSCTRHSRRRLSVNIAPGRKKIRHKIINFSRQRPRRDTIHTFANFSITFFLLACSTLKGVPILVSGFVRNNDVKPSARNIAIQSNHIRNLPNLPHRAPETLLFGKPDDKNGGNTETGSSGFGSFFNRGDKKDDSKRSQEDSKGGSFFNRGDKKDDGKSSEEDSKGGSFFNRGDKKKDSKRSQDDSKDEEEKAKGIPIVGRFFATDEEKEERRQVKEKEKKEKERWRREAKEERKRRQQERKTQDDDERDTKRNNVIPNVKNYLRERQIRKDAEVLRFQVKRMEEERQKQMEKDAEELRQAVREQELERKLQFPQLTNKIKLPTAPVSLPKEDIVRRKIQSQRELDRKRRERLEKIREGKSRTQPFKPPPKKTAANKKSGNGQDDTDTKPSKSERFGGVVSAAQKLVSGVFDGNKEEWIVVAPKTRISPGEIVAVTAAGIDLLLVASKDGSAVHCVANSCPHLGTPLEVGSLERLPIESSGSETPDADGSVQPVGKKSIFQENDISSMLKKDGCEDCIVCPLHKTAFALESGEVRGEWCPYPPVIGKLTGTVKKPANLPVFDVRTKGKNIEVRLNTPVEIDSDQSKKAKKK